MGVSEEELDSIREAQALYLPGLFIIRKRAFVGDSGYAPENVAVDVPGRLIPGAGRWSQLADRYEGITPYRFTCAWDQELLASWYVIDENSIAYEIKDVLSGSSYQTATQALVDRVTGG